MSRADQERQPKHGDSRRSQTRWEDAQRIHSAALRYLCLGWSVIPVRPRGKTPLVHWQEYQQRLPGDTEIEAWFRHWRFANIGIITGKISGLVVLDVDPRHGGDQSLAEWRQRYGDLPESVRATTGGGGRHVYFATPQRILGNRAGVMPGIDLRSDFANQVNNSLCFPGIFRGVLDVRARAITDEMAIAAAEALAGLAEEQGMNENHILPGMGEIEVAARVAAAVGVKAQDQGLAGMRLSAGELHGKATQTIRTVRQANQMLVEQGVILRAPA